MSVDRRVSAELEEALARLLPDPPPTLGVAVSGGGDSMALLHLLHGWCAAREVRLRAVTVDHGLRPEAAAEAALAGRACAALGVAHDILRWEGWNGQGNLQDAARRARARLIAGWAGAAGIDHVAQGHTRDDQAETVLMRLARGSGVDGLAGIAPRALHGGLVWLRPLLEVSRADLRAVLEARGIGWAEDPSNADTRFDRVRARQLLERLQPLGLEAGRLAATASRMRAAARVLDAAARGLAEAACEVRHAAIWIDRSAFDTAEEDTRLRLLSGALRWVSGAEYRPRLAALRTLAESGGTLSGCRVIDCGAERFAVLREAAALEGVHAAPGENWDGHWRVTGPARHGLRVAALGARGVQLCPGWRDAGLPRALLEASPAVWNGEHLVAAPLADPEAGWQAWAYRGRDDFAAFLGPH